MTHSAVELVAEQSQVFTGEIGRVSIVTSQAEIGYRLKQKTFLHTVVRLMTT